MLAILASIIILYLVKTNDVLNSEKYSKEDIEQDFQNQHEDL